MPAKPRQSNQGHKGKSTRCWKGYEPVSGKKAFSKGSCRKTPKNAE